MRATSLVSIILLAMMGLASVGAVINKHDVSRETKAYLPTFSQKDNDHGYYYEYYYRNKSNKKSKKNYKADKKDKSYKKDKQDKKSYNYAESVAKSVLKPTRIPTPTPTSSPFHSQTEIPASSADSNSEDDCPPVRPPTVIPPSPSIITGKPTSTNSHASEDGSESTKQWQWVEMDLDAIDYKLLRNDSPPMKVDFLELQTVTASYFEDYMIDAYQVSTQADLVDFTTLFVTAHFTPADPIHVQYQSSAYFSADSINIPSAETLTNVLLQSLDDPKPYIDKLKAELSDSNPFCTTIEATFTDPRAIPVTRSYFTSQMGEIPVARIAGAIACFTITIFASFLFLRRRNVTVHTIAKDSNYIYDDEVRSKRRNGNTVNLREAFVDESGDGAKYYQCSATSSSKTSTSNSEGRHLSQGTNREKIHRISSKNKSCYARSGLERDKRSSSSHKLHLKGGNMAQASDQIDFDYRRPETTKEIRKYLNVMDGDII